MARRRRPQDLSEAELRRLLIEKRSAGRKKRLEAFHRSGRLVSVAPDQYSPPLKDLRAIPLDDLAEEASRSPRQRFLDRALLAVEVLAIVGLVFVMFNGVSLVQTLNEEVTAALLQPALTPTPLVTVAVLPTGHTPPTSPGGARPNESEIPEHLRAVVQSQVNIALPTPGAEQAVRIQIPAIKVDAPIVQGDSWEQLKKGVAQHLGTANPGQNGNLVLSAHNDIFGEIFRYLDQLTAGDEVIVFTNIRAYTYIVTGWQVVDPLYVQVMDPTPDPTATLISCYPYLIDNQRIVVSASLQDN